MNIQEMNIKKSKDIVTIVNKLMIAKE